MKILHYGDYGTDVFTLQRLLQRLGYDWFVPTGYFGEKTYKALAKFQKRNALPYSIFLDQPTADIINQTLSSNRSLLYQVALNCLGTDASPNDIAPDEYGCAETVTTIIRKAGFYELGIQVSTNLLYNILEASPKWTRVDTPLEGDVIISPTGYGNGKLSNGHVGICGKNGVIMSNNSFTGLFEENYTQSTWKARYKDLGGYPIIYYRRIN